MSDILKCYKKLREILHVFDNIQKTNPKDKGNHYFKEKSETMKS